MNKFYIVNDRSFKNKAKAISFCNSVGLNPEESIIETAEIETKEKYYLLKTQGFNWHMTHLTWLTSTQSILIDGLKNWKD